MHTNKHAHWLSNTHTHTHTHTPKYAQTTTHAQLVTTSIVGLIIVINFEVCECNRYSSRQATRKCLGTCIFAGIKRHRLKSNEFLLEPQLVWDQLNLVDQQVRFCPILKLIHNSWKNKEVDALTTTNYFLYFLCTHIYVCIWVSPFVYANTNGVDMGLLVNTNRVDVGLLVKYFTRAMAQDLEIISKTLPTYKNSANEIY